MNDTFEVEDTKYWWWAGPANDGAKEGFCVHCRQAHYGVTRYIDSEPSREDALQIAKELAPMISRLG